MYCSAERYLSPYLADRLLTHSRNVSNARTLIVSRRSVQSARSRTLNVFAIQADSNTRFYKVEVRVTHRWILLAPVYLLSGKLAAISVRRLQYCRVYEKQSVTVLLPVTDFAWVMWVGYCAHSNDSLYGIGRKYAVAWTDVRSCLRVIQHISSSAVKSHHSHHLKALLQKTAARVFALQGPIRRFAIQEGLELAESSSKGVELPSGRLELAESSAESKG
eukprot:1190610-Prorocentrum_minimum.AAC.1